MVSTSEAKTIIQNSVPLLPPVQSPLLGAVGLTLAADVYAKTDIPAFPQSSMDGYAISFTGWESHKKLIIDGEVAAGDIQPTDLDERRAIRIFTGAAVPRGADTVVMQEKIRIENGELIVDDENLQPGINVRPQGSEIKAGALALPKETNLSPASIGFLAGIGITEVMVYPNPSITLIVTGNELQQPGNLLKYGQVYESNSFTLAAALEQLHIQTINVYQVNDDLELLTNKLREALQLSDVVLLTGGVSVGDYDFVSQSAARCGISRLFHKVKQRPGKPLYFGKKDNKLVFGLPGNPSSVLTCFYQYVVIALEKLSGRKINMQVEARLSKSYQKSAGLTHFLKGFYDGKTATPLDAQESYRMSSFAKANCLIQINENVTNCSEGETVEVYLLPV